MKKMILSFIIMSMILFTFLKPSYKVEVQKQLRNLNLDKINKLMIVAHPDDETIWGANHLLKDDYLVVCITCGNNKIRVNEINKVLKYSNDKLIMLNFPDKILGKRSNWKNDEEKIKKDIKKILEYKNWDVVVTHNPDGEYGHIHHKMTSKIVTNLYDKDNLYYFGKYYKKNDIKDIKVKNKLNKKELKNKKKMLDVYKSQGFIDDKFGHMYPYENWTKAK